MKRPSKIKLNRETVRTLAVPELRGVAGGAEPYPPPASVGNYCTTVYTGALNCRFATEGC